MSDMSTGNINILGQEVYTRILHQIKLGRARNIRISKGLQQEVTRTSERNGLLAKLGYKKAVPIYVILSAALMLCLNNASVEKSTMPKPKVEPKTTEMKGVGDSLHTAALSNIENLAESAGQYYKDTDMDKIADKIYARYKIEKGLKVYNNNLTPGELSELSSAILKASDRFELPPELITGIVITESRGRRFSKSGAGAYGPMQVMYSVHGRTLKKFGVHKADDLYNAEKGILSGSWIFKGYLERSRNNVKRALARYYGANDPNYYNSTLKRASVVKNVKIPANILNPDKVFASLGLDQAKTDRFYRMIYASTLGDGMTLKEAAAWLSADSPELSEDEKSRTLALLRYFGNGEGENILKFPKSMQETAEKYIHKIGEKKYLEEVGADLLHAHVIATAHKAGHELFIDCAFKAEDRIDEIKEIQKYETQKAELQKQQYAQEVLEF